MVNNTLYCRGCGKSLNLSAMYISSIYCSSKCRVKTNRLVNMVRILKKIKKYNQDTPMMSEGVTSNRSTLNSTSNV